MSREIGSTSGRPSGVLARERLQIVVALLGILAMLALLWPAATLAAPAVLDGPVGTGSVPVQASVGGAESVRQATPDLTATKTNNVSGSVATGAPWTWTVTIQNVGQAPAAFAASQIVLRDDLPNANVTYGSPAVTPFGGASGLVCVVDFTYRLSCSADVGGATLPVNGGFQVALTATASVLGSYANPRAGGSCTVDPNNEVTEGLETNNECANTVNVLGPDLSIAKSNNVNGTTVVGTPWTWTVTLTNIGATAATFTDSQIVLWDNLPNANATYGTPDVTLAGGVSGTGALACVVDFSYRLTCSTAGGTVVLPATSSITVRIAATASAIGAYANPRAGQTCLADPNNAVTENNEGNNSCVDSVNVLGADLTVTKTNNVPNGATPGTPWVWTLTIANAGVAPATFTSGQFILTDHLPNTNVSYGTPVVTPNGTTGTVLCTVDFTYRLVCSASGGSVTLPPGSNFQVALSATASIPGPYVNPHAGGVCQVDPDGNLAENSEANNACANTVTVNGPDLTVTKTNNVAGIAAPGVPWTWTLTIANAGTLTATVPAGQFLVLDNLPDRNIVYGAVSVTPTGSASGPLACTIDFTYRLTCEGAGGNVTIPVGGSFQVAFTATTSVAGAYANPRVGGSCQADPNNLVVESNEANNTCADTVTLGGQAVQQAAGGPHDPNNDDEDEEKKPRTEAERHRRAHTNASGQDDYHTEGNVLEVRCNQDTPPQYDVPFPTHTPYLVLGTKEGKQQLRLTKKDARDGCQSARVGDYAEADGDKEHELLFNAHTLDLK
jgi:large repetitive protein